MRRGVLNYLSLFGCVISVFPPQMQETTHLDQVKVICEPERNYVFLTKSCVQLTDISCGVVYKATLASLVLFRSYRYVNEPRLLFFRIKRRCVARWQDDTDHRFPVVLLKHIPSLSLRLGLSETCDNKKHTFRGENIVCSTHKDGVCSMSLFYGWGCSLFYKKRVS